jgi:hypothetical protein
MDKAIELFGRLVLTFLGIVAPIFAILLANFRQGMSRLSVQYADERTQSENNIYNQLEELKSKRNEADILKSLKQLRANKRAAERKINRLNPRRQIPELFGPLLVSFVAVSGALYVSPCYSKIALLAVAIVGFAYALFSLYSLLDVLIEARKMIDDDTKQLQVDVKDVTAKNVDLLTNLSLAIIELRKSLSGKDQETSATEKLLKELVDVQSKQYLKNVYVILNGKEVKGAFVSISLFVNKEEDLNVTFVNVETRMAKNVELGFSLPSDFLIAKKDAYTIYPEGTVQHVRYSLTSLQANTTQLMKQPITVTPMKEGTYNVTTWIKAENIESITRVVQINVTSERKPAV